LKQVVTAALLVRSIPYGEADLVVTLMTEALGKVAGLVRGGRRSSRRMGGALEPFHTIEVTLDDRGGDLVTVKEARLLQVREGIVARLESVEAAGTALRWARHVVPVRTPEGAAYRTLIDLLDELEALEREPSAADDAPRATPRGLLAGAGLRLLANIGYALDFDRCVRCSKPCPRDRPACIDAARGGIVCTACGGAARIAPADLRALASALQAGPLRADRTAVVTPSQANDLLAVVEQAMTAHTGFDG
jgi:DNA repair protein RecO (recombination protein O)